MPRTVILSQIGNIHHKDQVLPSLPIQEQSLVHGSKMAVSVSDISFIKKERERSYRPNAEDKLALSACHSDVYAVSTRKVAQTWMSFDNGSQLLHSCGSPV